MRRRARFLPVVAVLTVLGVTGCAAGDDGSTASTTNGAIEVTSDDPTGQATTASAAAPTVPRATDGTVTSVTPAAGDATTSDGMSTNDADLLTRLYALLDVGTRAELTATLAMSVPEDVIAQCMTDAGFQYVPGASAEERVASDVRYTMPADEYAALYGLGITGWELGLIPDGLPDAPEQPNASSQSRSQRDAYQQARTACFRQSDPDGPARSNALNVALEEFRGTVAADDRVVAALTAWQACMAEAGYEFTSPEAMSGSFYTRMNSGIGHDALVQLNTEEIAVAVANVPCEAAYTTEYRAVVLDRFREFQRLYETAIATGAAPDAQG